MLKALKLLELSTNAFAKVGSLFVQKKEENSPLKVNLIPWFMLYIGVSAGICVAGDDPNTGECVRSFVIALKELIYVN